jgi:crotonobetainyl-CoA:carnitine CoA-transferase CaiB-like acyl-CoA transferase
MTVIGLLAGIRVLELAEGTAGPCTGSLLAAAGADVVKIEPPGGDRSRGWTPVLGGGMSAPFLALNRNKRSACLDLTAPDVNIGPALVSWADVVIVDHTTAPITPEEVAEVNPDAVYCRVSGFGPDGPQRDEPSDELPAQLLSEVTASLGVPGEPPVRLGTDVAGMYTGIYGLQAVTAALVARETSGRGQLVDVSLLGSLLAMRSTLWVSQSCPDEWWGFHLDSYTKDPWPGYRCKSGRIFAWLRGPAFRNGLVEDLRMEWVYDDPRLPLVLSEGCAPGTRHTDELTEVWDRAFADFTIEELITLTEPYGGQVVPAADYAELARDRHAREAGLFRRIDQPGIGPVDVVAPPWTHFDGEELGELRPAPRLGEHTAEVLRELTGSADDAVPTPAETEGK